CGAGLLRRLDRSVLPALHRGLVGAARPLSADHPRQHRAAELLVAARPHAALLVDVAGGRRARRVPARPQPRLRACRARPRRPQHGHHGPPSVTQRHGRDPDVPALHPHRRGGARRLRSAEGAVTPLLAVRDLSVSFAVQGGEIEAVRHVSFDIERGQSVALVGESGSGKSVTALSIVQLLPYPTARHPSGSIRLEGEELVGAPEAMMQRVRGDRIAMIFQEPMTSLNPLHTIEKQVNEILRVHKRLSRSAARARTLELLRLVGLPEAERRLDAYPHQLSGGQRQRVMIAMALANEPDLLIADEPTTALDVTIQAQILPLLRELQAKFAMALLLI